jgi:dTDP-4-dehydrorhamnose reductase
MTTVWITGAAGLIGHHLVQAVPASLFGAPVRVVPLTRAELDLLDFPAVTARFHADRPALVLHCAAMSRPPACEREPELARRINIEATRHLADLSAGIPFVFFSTDLVFDGRKGHYKEGDAVNPLNEYARTKVAAEQAVLRHPRALILRTSLNHGTSPRGSAFNEELLATLRAGHDAHLNCDEYRCPIPASVTARATWELAALGCTGIYHVAGAERLTRFEIGLCVIRGQILLIPKLQPVTLRSHTGPPRPPDTSLDCAKAQAKLSFPLPYYSDWCGTRIGRRKRVRR